MKNKKQHLNIEVSLPKNKKNLNGYDKKDWSFEKCTRPIYINPKEFSFNL